MKNQIDVRTKLEELGEEIKILNDGLMEQEIRLVDQNEVLQNKVFFHL